MELFSIAQSNDKNLNDDKSKSAVKIIALSGTETVTKNMTLYECEDTIIALDCGVDFPDNDALGVNVVIPDFNYLEENVHKFKALFITHGHEDHIGAIPFFMENFDVPIYAGKLVQGIVTEKLKDKSFKRLLEKVKFHTFTPDTPEVTVGPFRLSCFSVNHSVPEATGIVIKTPQGTILHMADYKIDKSPILEKPMDLGVVEKLGNEGVLCLLSDCLGVTKEGSSKTEQIITQTIEDLVQKYDDRQLLFTTLSSNIGRMKQIIDAAKNAGRRLVFIGRSIHQNFKVARSLGYLDLDDSFIVGEKEVADYNQKDLVYIIAGAYGTQGSALDRLSRGEHDYVKLEKDSIVVFTADPSPPGVDVDVERVMANLTLSGAEAIYSDIQEDLYVSGHGTREDLMTVAKLSKAKYYIPIGGTLVKMRAYKNIIHDELGVNKDNVFELHEGDVLSFEKNSAKVIDKIDVKQIYIGADGVTEVNPIVLRDRGQLATEGVFVVVIPSSNDNKLMIDKVEVITRGFIYVKESAEFMGKSKKYIAKVLNKHMDKRDDWQTFRRKVENDIASFLKKETRHTPLVIIHTLNI
jgi:ribonuclease J